MFLKDKYGKKWKLQAAKVLRTGALCVALAGVGTGVMGTLGELGADLGRLGLITAYADEFADRPEEVEGSSQIQVGNADGSDAEKEDTKGSDTAQWMGQVETDETKLQDNQLEYRIFDNCTSNRGSLLLSSGKLVRQLVLMFINTQRLHQLIHIQRTIT